MPEQLTKHPEVTLKVLRSAGAKCSEGAKQEILTQCPAERFCKLPGGEICVFGLSDASKMTQITAAEWKDLVQSLPAARSSSSDSGGTEVLLSAGSGLLAAAVIALAVTRLWRNAQDRTVAGQASTMRQRPLFLCSQRPSRGLQRHRIELA